MATSLRKLGSKLPPFVRVPLRRIVRRLLKHELASIDELDAALEGVERAFAVSEDEGRRAFASFYLAPPRDLPPDPSSPEYRSAQFELYRKISRRPGYSVANEMSPFDLDQAKECPFPYQTRSPRVVGEQLIAQGFLLRALPIAPPAHLVEFGAGWGNTTLQLLEMGFDVTVVEVDQRFADLIAHRCAKFNNRLTISVSDMLEFEPSKKFDTAIFFESFHHCADHVKMLRRVRSMLKREGALVLAGEPIESFPYPWGVRLDGESLWSMRKYGWLELGFDEKYFFSLLRSEGWSYKHTRNADLGTLSNIIVAR